MEIVDAMIKRNWLIFALASVLINFPFELTWPWSKYCLKSSKNDAYLCSHLSIWVKSFLEIVFQLFLFKTIEIPMLFTVHRFVLQAMRTLQMADALRFVQLF